ncbi:hypothetical protein [Colwellia sp. Arc7-635]|uniref:hypothetical protein n=1 Tax=Colwellia sp. Arc7-635 TaxID=2497879 RepID=UPI0019CFC73B|nr:hypothetical protein [Colwellia sp. Arc7-635]
MPSSDPVVFSASANVETSSGTISDTVAYTCKVKERNCTGVGWGRIWEEKEELFFIVKLSNSYFASISTPSCRLSADMIKNDNYGYTEIITVYDSSTNEQVYRATANNSDLKKFNFQSLSVKVE